MFRRITQQFTSEGCPIDFTETRYYVFKNKNLLFENSVFTPLALACVRESVRPREVGKGESHFHPFHVDI